MLKYSSSSFRCIKGFDISKKQMEKFISNEQNEQKSCQLKSNLIFIAYIRLFYTYNAAYIALKEI